MKRFILYLTMIVASIVSFSSLEAKAQSFPDEDDVIEVDLTDYNKENFPKRLPQDIPVSAKYFPHLSSVGFTFFYNIGDVAILIIDNDTGRQVIDVVNSSVGVSFLPLPSTGRSFTIYLYVQGGTSYIGRLFIGS